MKTVCCARVNSWQATSFNRNQPVYFIRKWRVAVFEVCQNWNIHSGVVTRCHNWITVIFIDFPFSMPLPLCPVITIPAWTYWYQFGCCKFFIASQYCSQSLENTLYHWQTILAVDVCCRFWDFDTRIDDEKLILLITISEYNVYNFSLTPRNVLGHEGIDRKGLYKNVKKVDKLSCLKILEDYCKSNGLVANFTKGESSNILRETACNSIAYTLWMLLAFKQKCIYSVF